MTAPLVDVAWEEPPPIVKNPANFYAIAQTLQQRPGHWAKVGESLTYLEMKRMYDGLRAVGARTSRRMQHDGETYDLYARWPVSQ